MADVVAPQAGAGAFERAVDRVDGRVEHRGDFDGVIAEHLAQDQHGTLARGQQLQRGDEGERDRFVLLIARLGTQDLAASRWRFRGSASGYGSSHTTSPSRLGSGGSTCGMSHSFAGRRLAERSALRQRLVAMR